jgi:hypothetical protein
MTRYYLVQRFIIAAKVASGPPACLEKKEWFLLNCVQNFSFFLA